MGQRFLILLPILMFSSGFVESGNATHDVPAPASSMRAAFPSEADIQVLLEQRVKDLGGSSTGIGIVVGLIGPQARSIVSYGQSGNSRPLDSDTAFEIGSVSKVFTALLLADMVQRDEIALSDPVENYLPVRVSVPRWKDRPITLAELATHTSGLPFMPDDLPAFNDTEAAKDADAKIYKFLAHYARPSDAGTQWNYSNIGYWLWAKPWRPENRRTTRRCCASGSWLHCNSRRQLSLYRPRSKRS